MAHRNEGDLDREYGGRDHEYRGGGYRGGGVDFGMGIDSERLAQDDDVDSGDLRPAQDLAAPDTTGSEGGGTKMPRARR